MRKNKLAIAPKGAIKGGRKNEYIHKLNWRVIFHLRISVQCTMDKPTLWKHFSFKLQTNLKHLMFEKQYLTTWQTNVELFLRCFLIFEYKWLS